ncbi:MAG: hypothetical protein ACFFBD_04700, partial [Candidatus Hodarchaeota archaeon]
MNISIPVNTSESTTAQSVLKMQEEFFVARVVFNITTTTDWMTFSLLGEETLFGLNVSILEGEYAPNLSYNVDSSAINIGKASFDDTRVSIKVIVGLLGLKNGTLLNLKIEKGDIGFSRIEIYNYNLEEPNLVSNITHWTSQSGTNPYPYSITDWSLLAPQAFFSFESASTRPKSVLAFYYPWYGNPEVSGEWVHWQDFRNNPNSIQNGTRDLASTDYPSMGAYDSNNPSTVRYHIQMAQAAGIDAFISSWWGIDTFEDKALSVLLNQAVNTNFSITIYFETAPYWSLNENTAYNLILNDLRYIYDNYANHPAFYKVNLVGNTEPLI